MTDLHQAIESVWKQESTRLIAGIARVTRDICTAEELAQDALLAALEAHGVDLAKPVITTCGSGVTAAILALAVEQAGGKVAGLYDGSWAEWGGRDDCPVVTVPAK